MPPHWGHIVCYDKEMKKQPTSSLTIGWMLIICSLAGIALSISLTTDSQWTSWHLSRLGEGGSYAAFIFNTTFLLAAILMLLLTRALARELFLVASLRRRTRLIIFNTLVATCWAGIGIFPFDQFPVIHNIFGYGQFLLLAILMVHMRRICPVFTERTYVMGAGVVLITSTFLALFHLTHVTTLLTVEIIGQLGIYLWLLSLTYDAGSLGMKKADRPLEDPIRLPA